MIPTFLVILTLAVLYWFPLRRWMSRWGTTPSDLAPVMAGDGLVANPTFSYTMSVIVDAPPEELQRFKDLCAGAFTDAAVSG